MEPVIEDSQSTTATPVGGKRMKLLSEIEDCCKKALSASIDDKARSKKQKTSSKVRYLDPFDAPSLLEGCDYSLYGSSAKQIQILHARRMQILDLGSPTHLTPQQELMDENKSHSADASGLMDQKATQSEDDELIILDDYPVANVSEAGAALPHVIILDSDEEDKGDQRHSYSHEEIVLEKPAAQTCEEDLMAKDLVESKALMDEGKFMVCKTEIRKDGVDSTEITTPVNEEGSLAGELEIKKYKGVCVIDCAERTSPTEEESHLYGETKTKNDKGVYVGVEDDIIVEERNSRTNIEDDGLADMWKEMRVALECSKDVAADQSSYEKNSEEECDHLFVLKDDIGDVCRICGIIKRTIDNIFDFQYKVKKYLRTYKAESWNTMEREPTGIMRDGPAVSEQELMPAEFSAHPRHKEQMKPHQTEGFKFLISNLMANDPGGCIMAHAPGSGKTFMMISFIQIFLAKYPRERVLVVLPKGILPTWRKEFETWQIEDIPLYDFYSVKADNRSQQLEVLNKWVEQKSILFLGYKQFSTIVCDEGNSKAAANCREILLKVPAVLVLDEGHTPRNEETEIWDSVSKVQTRRKVILSGTLYQNHVKEVFNILNLARPRFLKLESSRIVVNRIMSRLKIQGVRKQLKAGADSAFYDLVEYTLQKDEDLRRRESVIKDLREMTSKVLHYYKGDFLDELPGLVDFTVLLNLSEKQKPEVAELKKLEIFNRSCTGSLVYLHPQLKYFLENNPTTGNKGSVPGDEKIDEMLKRLDLRDGVKAKFFRKILDLCESSGEKLLVFSQYLLPLKFLERLAVNAKGWSLGKELFMISGKTNSALREWSMERFNSSPDARVLFGSIKACGEGISLVGASRILILDVHLNPSVTRQAIGRAFRPGQMRKVYAYRLVAAESPEEEDHLTCFRKESISKMWFEWSEDCGQQDFKMKTVDLSECYDEFLESSFFQDDIKVLHRR